MEFPCGVRTIPKVLCKSVERFGRSGVGFGGVDPRVLFTPTSSGHTVWPVPLTGLTGADSCWVSLGWTSGCVRCCPVLLLFHVWSSVGLFGRLGVSWIEPVWPVGYTGPTGVGASLWKFPGSPAGTGLTGGAHQPDRCRSMRLELVFHYTYLITNVKNI
jgi:hypothetical protein